jgi:hypothetical protein
MRKQDEVIVEVEGHFWWLGEDLPEGKLTPLTALPGRLTISGNGLAKLVVNGSLMESSLLRLDRQGRRAAESNVDALEGRSIVGRVEKDFQSIYLRNVVYRTPGRTFDGRISESFQAGFCLIGHKTIPQSESQLAFSRLSIELSGLEEWRWNDALIVDAARAHEGEHSQAIRWCTQAQEYTVERGRIRLRTDIHCNQFEGARSRDVSFRQYDWLDYLPDSPKSPEQLKQEFGHIEEFLALLTGVYYHLDWPQLSNDDLSGRESYTLYFHRNKEAAEPLEVIQMWTTFPQVEKNFGALYANARGKRKEYGAGFYLRLGALRSSSMYIEHQFVNLIWGIESLHRTAQPSARGSSSNYEMIQGFMEKLQGDMNADSRRWFNRQLEFALEPQLRDRIVGTFSKLPWDIELSSLNRFAERCAKRRNDISHYGGPRQGDEDTYEEFLLDLLRLSAALSVLYHAALLREIGVDEKTLRQCLLNMPISWRIHPALMQAGLGIPPLPRQDGHSEPTTAR